MPSTAAPSDATAPTKPQTLTLPAPVIATLSPRPYLVSHLQSAKPVRPNGRTPRTFRDPTCTTSSLSHCAGSAVVRLGDTAVACGIQAELLHTKDIADTSSITHPPAAAATSAGQNHDRQNPTSDLPSADSQATLERLQLLVPNIDLATGCSPQHLPGTGGPPSAVAQTLTHRLYRLLLSSRLVHLEDLAITHYPLMNEEGEDAAGHEEEAEEQEPETIAYWTLHASLTVLSLAGTVSLLDALWGCLLAALKDVRLPKAWWDPDREMILCSDLVEDARRLRLFGRPFMATWGVFEGRAEDAYMSANDGEEQRNGTKGTQDTLEGDSLGHGKQLDRGGRAWWLADPDAFEDALCSETVSITLDCSGGKTVLLRVEKNGGRVTGMQELNELTHAAEERWKAWDAVIPR